MAAYTSKLIPESIHIQIWAFVKKKTHLGGNLFNLERTSPSSPDALCPKSKTNKIKNHKTSIKLSKIKHTDIFGKKKKIKTFQLKKTYNSLTVLPKTTAWDPNTLAYIIFLWQLFCPLTATHSINGQNNYWLNSLGWLHELRQDRNESFGLGFWGLGRGVCFSFLAKAERTSSACVRNVWPPRGCRTKAAGRNSSATDSVWDGPQGLAGQRGCEFWEHGHAAAAGEKDGSFWTT